MEITEWKKGVKYEDGIYEGDMTSEGIRHGYGIFSYNDGRKYYGEFRQDKRDGNGLVTFSNSEVYRSYRGEFKNDLKHGIGVDRTALDTWETHVYEAGKLVKDEEMSEFSKNYYDDPSKEANKRRYAMYRDSSLLTPVARKDLSGKHPRTQSCHNIRACWNFIEFVLKMDTKWFRFDYNVCFCRICVKRGFVADTRKGSRGGKMFTYPLGWVKFGLPIPSFFESAGSVDVWHRGFHGTRAETSKIIVTQSRGGLLLPGDVTPSGFVIPVVNPIGRDESWTKQFFMSPSINYVEKAYSPEIEYNGDLFKVAFEVSIEPQTYSVGPATVKKDHLIDPLFPGNKNLEWFTNRRNVAVLSGFLVKRVFDGAKDMKKEEDVNEEESEGEEDGKSENAEKKEEEDLEIENSKLKKRLEEMGSLMDNLRKENEELKQKMK